MLILSRKPGETIRAGKEGEFTITVLSVHGNQVRVGINAPRDVPVHRQEIFERIQQETAGGTPAD